MKTINPEKTLSKHPQARGEDRIAVPPRAAISALAAMLLAWQAFAVAAACEVREPTRATGMGPHFVTDAPADTQLWREGEPGEPVFFRARVIDTCGEPIPGVRVRLWHANQDGFHSSERWRAEFDTDEDGSFQVVTVLPGFAGGISRHIHFILTHPGHRELITRLFFKNDTSIDASVQDLAMSVEEVEREDGRAWLGGFEFVLEPRGG